MPVRPGLGLGDPVVHRLTWAIALPAIVANVSGPLVGVVDTWAMGRLGDPIFLAAIAAGSYSFHVLYWAFGFLRMGTTGLIAQGYGRRAGEEIARRLAAALILALVVGALVLGLQEPVFAALARALDLHPEVRELARRYWHIRVWGAPAILVRLALIGTLIGLQGARQAMVVEVTLNVVNAVLTAALVAGFGLGIAGAGFGSLIAELAAVLLAVVLVAGQLRRRLGLRKRNLLAAVRGMALAELQLVAHVNGFIFLRTLLLLLAFGLFWRESGGLGTAAFAANQVAMNLLMLTSFGLDGLAYAAEALVGEAAGRRDLRAMGRRIWVTGLWSAVMAAAYSGLWVASSDALFGWFTRDPDLLTRLAAVAPVVVVLPLAGFLSYHMDGVFIGLAAARAMFATMALALAGYVLALAVLPPALGNLGLWLALALFLVLRGLVQLVWLVTAWRRGNLVPAPAESGR